MSNNSIKQNDIIIEKIKTLGLMGYVSAFIKKLKILYVAGRLHKPSYASFETMFGHQMYSEPIKFSQSKCRRLSALGSQDFYYSKYFSVIPHN